MATIQFRCPHASIKADGSEGAMTRDAKAKLRVEHLDIPEGTEWVRVEEDFDRDKTVRRRDALGEIVSVKPYEHELGHYWKAVVTCPVCGDKRLVRTNQDPEATA